MCRVKLANFKRKFTASLAGVIAVPIIGYRSSWTIFAKRYAVVRLNVIKAALVIFIIFPNLFMSNIKSRILTF